MHWYDDFDHIGYDLDGNKIAKPARMDKIDQFIALNENPNAWKTVIDEKTGKKHVISDKDMQFIRRLQQGVADDRYDSENWFIEHRSVWDQFPTTAEPIPKRRFVPSVWEAKRVWAY